MTLFKKMKATIHKCLCGNYGTQNFLLYHGFQKPHGWDTVQIMLVAHFHKTLFKFLKVCDV